MKWVLGQTSSSPSREQPSASAASRSPPGEYEISGTINGRPSWISNDQAIWWLPQYSEWAIGTELGSDIRGVTGVSSDNNDFAWPNDHKYTWKYWNGTAWTPAANDIKVQCKATGNMYIF